MSTEQLNSKAAEARSRSGGSRRKELEVLYVISESIGGQLELQQVLNQIVTLVHDLTKGDSCLLYLLDENRRDLVLRASKYPHQNEIGTIRLALGEGITGWVAREQQVVAIPRGASADPRFKFFFNLPEDRYEAFLSVPITTQNRTIGVINVQHRSVRRHRQSEVKLLSIIGQQVGRAIENARLYEEAARRAQQIEKLSRVSQTVSSNLYLQEILDLVVHLAADTVEASICSIMLVDAQRQELIVRAARCSNEEYLNKPPLKIGESLVGRVIRERRIIIFPDIFMEPDYQYPDLAVQENLRTLVSLPLIVKDGIIGVLNCYTPAERAPAQEDIQLLDSIAHQAALAIENTRLMEEAHAAQEALESRKLVERAKGILQQEAGISESEAYSRLQLQSRRLRKPMKEIARAIILMSELKRTTDFDAG